MPYVFVYGTLQRGQSFHYVMTDRSMGVATFIGAARTVDRYPLIKDGYYGNPKMLNARGRGKNVRGEVYQINDLMLENLDKLELHPEYYERRNIKVTFIKGNNVDEKNIPEVTSSDGENQTLECMAYLVSNFRPSLLDKKCYEEYRDGGELQYRGKQIDPEMLKKDFEDNIFNL